MNISINRINDAWQELKNPCDYPLFVVQSLAYTVTLGNCDFFPRVYGSKDDEEEILSSVKVVGEKKDKKQSSQILKDASECIYALDNKNIEDAAKLLNKIFWNLDERRKTQIRKVLGDHSKSEKEISNQSTEINDVCTYIDKDQQRADLFNEALTLLNEAERHIIRCNLSIFVNKHEDKEVLKKVY